MGITKVLKKIKRQKLRNYPINHPRLPYTCRCFVYSTKNKKITLVVIPMTKKFFRVIYPPTGVCLTDTHGFEPAYRFVQKLLDILASDSALFDRLNQVQLHMFPTCLYPKDSTVKPVKLLTKDLYYLTSAAGHVSHKRTAACRYKHKPEYLL